MEKIAIDLTWVRHNQVGGTESSVRNLLDGFAEVNCGFIRFILLCSKDNCESFSKYAEYDCYDIETCDVLSNSQKQRIIWQNTKLGKELRKQNIKKCLEPVYSKPFLGCRGIDFYTIIHDLQAFNYPEYFSKGRVVWMKLSWWNSVHTSKMVIAISNYVREDILLHYRVANEKVVTIYDAINIDFNEIADDSILEKLKIKDKEFYYTVSSLLPHKNLKTIIKALGILKAKNSEVYYPLVISGVGGKDKQSVISLAEECNMKDEVILTPFVENEERNKLYSSCKAFLFPSIFEGFGMPPIEAMAFGNAVITTKETSLLEVTGGCCEYVDNPTDEVEWAEKIENYEKKYVEINALLKCYKTKAIADKYINMFAE